MSPDRHGENQTPSCRNPDCRRGWIGHDDEYRPIPCPECKRHLAQRKDVNDFAEREPSARAQAAIESENR